MSTESGSRVFLGKLGATRIDIYKASARRRFADLAATWVHDLPAEKTVGLASQPAVLHSRPGLRKATGGRLLGLAVYLLLFWGSDSVRSRNRCPTNCRPVLPQ
jgi:hypothetical protein